jgi:mono/diheme cytochrome c family protein
VSRRTVRLVVVPAILFVVVVGSVYALAEWAPAKRSGAAAEVPYATGSGAERGQALYEDRCAQCHDTGVAPSLQGQAISVDDARAQIENGGGGMPADLVTGQDLEDVLAYLETVFGS